MKLSDLTPAELRQVRTGQANTSARGAGPQPSTAPHPTGSRPSISGETRQGACPASGPIWGCHDCPATFTTLADAERHTGPGHRRLDWLLGRKEPANG